MLRTQQHQVIEAGFTAGGPVLDVMCIDKAFVVTAGKGTSFVPGLKGTFDRRRYGAGLATDVQRLAVLAFTKDNRMAVTTKSFDAFDRETGTTVAIGQRRLIDVDGDQVII